MLSESSDSEFEDVHQLTVNEHYAKAYAYKKEREELQKLKEKYGSDVDEGDLVESDDSEDLESEDEDGEELTPAVDAAILRTLARIKRRDPEIYKTDSNIFAEEQQRGDNSTIRRRRKEDKIQPVTIRQQALQDVLNPTDGRRSPEPLTYNQEQHALRSETIAAFHGATAGDDSEGEEDGLLVPREKTKDELQQEEEDYRAFLEREVGQDIKELVVLGMDESKHDIGPTAVSEQESKDVKKAAKSTKRKGKGRQEDADQQFLLDYILNRGWIDRSARRVPTYQEVTKPGKALNSMGDAETDEAREAGDETSENRVPEDILVDDDEFDDVAERFESSYNFRFEEPDAATIKTYPRNLQSTVRREESSRKEQRDRRIQRKEEEMLQKREEVKRLKALKKKDMEAKLARIRREGGHALDNDDVLQSLDLDADWDPDAHDHQMGNIYGAEGVDDEEKPTWDDDIDIDDLVPTETNIHVPEDSTKRKKKQKKKAKGDAVDEGVDIDAMDADAEVDPTLKDGWDEWDGTEEMRKRILREYMEETEALEFNDMVGDMPTRFRYMPVEEEAFGLSAAEILTATDAELNQYMGLKKYAPYRQKREAKWDNNRNERLKEFRSNVGERLGRWGTRGDENQQSERPAKKRKGKKERMRERATESAIADDRAESVRETGARDESSLGHDGQQVGEESGRKHKRRRKHKNQDYADDALKIYD